MEEFIGVVKLFAGTFAPRGWQLCNGQLVGVAQNQALFAILGTNYGGNGQTTFGLPDLRGRVAVGWGQGAGLSNYAIGQVSGTEQVSILQSNMPAHTHTATSTLSLKASDVAATVGTPVSGSALAAGKDINTDAVSMYTSTAPTIPLAGGTVATTNALTGGNLPISILQPTLALTYIICVEGIFPSRN